MVTDSSFFFYFFHVNPFRITSDKNSIFPLCLLHQTMSAVVIGRNLAVRLAGVLTDGM
jgi:hypothetical protein